MKKLMLSFSPLLLFLFIVSCTLQAVSNNGDVVSSAIINENVSVQPIQKREEVEKNKDVGAVDAIVTMVNYYRDLDSLNNDTEVAVRGTVIENEYVEYGDMIFTLSKVEVKNVIKGEILTDIITVMQTGGIGEYSFDNSNNVKEFDDPHVVAENIEKYDGQKYEATFDGVNVLKENDEVILFLQKYEGPISNSAYVGIGGFQGHFIIEELDDINILVKPQSPYYTSEITYEDLININ